MLSGIWMKISAGFAVVAGVLFTLLKIQSKRLDKAQHEIKVHDKLEEIEEDQDELVKEVLNDEGKRIEKRKKTHRNRSAVDLNSL